MSQFEAVPPMWLVPAPSAGTYHYSHMVPLDDGVVALAFGPTGTEALPRLQRFSDDGELVWEVEVELHSGPRLASGAEFIYVQHETAFVRYRLDDGELLPWVATFDATRGVHAVEVDGSELWIGGGVEYGEDGHEQRDAWITSYDDAGNSLVQAEFGNPSSDEAIVAIEALSTGGAVAVLNFAGLQFRGYGGADLSFNLTGLGGGSPILVRERAEGLLTVVDGDPSGWTVLATVQGEELWRKPLQPCGSAPGVSLLWASVGEDRLWVSASSETGSLVPGSLIAEVSFDGELLNVRRFEFEDEYSVVQSALHRNGRLFAYGATGYGKTALGWIGRFE